MAYPLPGALLPIIESSPWKFIFHKDGHLRRNSRAEMIKKLQGSG
jgi:hypothetical protein